MFFYILFFMYKIIFMILLFMLNYTFMEEKFYILEWSILNFNFYFDLKFYFYFDYVSNIFMLIVSYITMVVFYFSGEYMLMDKKKNKFLFLTFMFVLSMYFMVLSMNMMFILIGWDGLGIVSYFLVIYYSSNYSHYCGLITVMSNRIGDIGMIFSLFLAINMNCFDILILNLEEKMNFLFFMLMLVGGLTKSAQFPFSAWLPLAMAAPTPISSLVHSSTLVTAGVYLFFRFHYLFKNNLNINSWLLVMVGLTMFLSGLSAISDFDIKKIIAYSTLSQLGLMIMILMLGNEMLSFFHVLTHALFKSLLFLCSGVFIHESLDNQDIREYSNLMKSNILIVSILFICSLSLMGFPYLSGFYSKDLILEFVYGMNYNLFYVIMLLFLTSLTTFYSMRLIKFSLLLSKNNMKFVFLFNWSAMNSMLFLLLFGVLFLGSMLSWLMMEKFKMIYLCFFWKILSLFVLVLGVFLFIFNNSILMNKNIYFVFVNLFYLTKIQGLVSNFLFGSFLYYYIHMEYFMEYFTAMKLSYFMSKMNNLMMVFKMLNMYMSMLFILVFLLSN